ncbi:MAG: flagellar motor switch protein FliN [Proteobacteria bacterium]|nr:flagellar motor switch protein FliN [Pseudomonadota bacterium]
MIDDDDINETENQEPEQSYDRDVPSAPKTAIRAEALDAVYDVPVQISAVLGRSTMPVNQLLKLGRGAVVELDKRVGEAIDIFVNNKLVARGEVVAVEDRIGITMTEIVKTERSM